MLSDFTLYDLFILSFVQLVVATVLVLSPARNLDTRFRWTGSRITEVILGALGRGGARRRLVLPDRSAVGIAAQRGRSGGLPARDLLVDRDHRPPRLQRRRQDLLRLVSRRPASRFSDSPRSSRRTATRSIAETLTASLLILLDLGAFLVWNSNINYVSDVDVPHPPLASASRVPTRRTSRWCRCTSRPTTSRRRC